MHRFAKTIFILHSIFFCGSCFQTKHELNLVPDEPLELRELVSAAQTPFSPRRKNHNNSEDQSSKDCIKKLKSIAPAARHLKRHLKGQSFFPDYPMTKISKMEPTHCTGPLLEKSSLAIKDLLTNHPKKIGVIIPRSGVYRELGDAIAKGLLAAEEHLAQQKKDSSIFIFKDSTSSPNGALHALAELVFHDQVSMIIGGVSKEAAEAIAPYSKRLSLPMLILNKDHHVVAKNSFTLQVYPNERDQARSLAKLSKKAGYQSIAILSPNEGKSDNLLKHLIREFEFLGIRVDKSVVYIPKNYESMNEAVEQVTQTRPGDRTEEHKVLLEQAQIEATDQGLNFNPTQVLLPPKLIADAVFIPDTFHIVRFFAKLFRYHGLEHLPLLGTQDWRSQELIKPWDNLLDGAVFADFVGPYDELPKPLAKDLEKVLSKSGSRFFVESHLALKIDFSLIGYRAGNIAIKTTMTDFLKRKQILSHLKRQTSASKDSQNEPVFYPDRSSAWPVHLFKVTNQELAVFR